MGRLGVEAGKDREVTPGQEEDYQGGDGARTGQGPQRTGNPSSEVGMWRGQWAGGHAHLDWSNSKPASLYRVAGWWDKAGWGPRDLGFSPGSYTSLLQHYDQAMPPCLSFLTYEMVRR